MSEEVADVEIAGEDDLGAGQVLERAAHDEVRGRKDDERGVVEPDRVHQPNGDACLRLRDGEPIDDSYSAFVCFLAERGAKRKAAHLLGHALRVAPRVRTENDAPALHRRLPRAAVSRAAGTFLAVRLGAAAGHGLPCLGRCGALARVRELADEGLVHDRRVHAFGEDQLRQPDLALACASGVEERSVEVVGLLARGGGLLRGGLFGGGLLLRHQTFLPVGLPAGPFTFTRLVDWRTRTSAPFAPGTPPLTRIRFRSGSTRTTM